MWGRERRMSRAQEGENSAGVWGAITKGKWGNSYIYGDKERGR